MVIQRRKKSIQSRMSEQHTPRQSLHAFNQSSNNELFMWRLNPDRQGEGQGYYPTHQQLINMAIDSLQDDEYICMPNLESDDEDQESVNVKPNLEVQDDGIIECMHSINIMAFPDEVIRVKKQTG